MQSKISHNSAALLNQRWTAKHRQSGQQLKRTRFFVVLLFVNSGPPSPYWLDRERAMQMCTKMRNSSQYCFTEDPRLARTSSPLPRFESGKRERLMGACFGASSFSTWVRSSESPPPALDDSRGRQGMHQL